MKLNLRSELIFTASRSSGPGGQHVNKVSTRIELRFNIPASKLLTDYQKQTLIKKLKNMVTEDGDVMVICQESRSQIKNKEKAIQKLYELIEKALKPVKKRIATKPTQGSKEKRLENKKKISDKKGKRKPPAGGDH
jgi:ribosome-associated protein